MCYSTIDSIISWVVNLGSSIYLFKYTNKETYKIIALFFLFVGQMQLFDVIFWTNQNCNLVNKIFTKIAILFNHLQPVVLFFLIKYFNKNNNIISRIVIIIYTFVVSFYTISLWQNINCTAKDKVCCSLPYHTNKNKIIKWEWNDQPLNILVYSLFMLALITSGYDLKNNNVFFILGAIITLLISHKINDLNKSLGRAWCYLAAFTPLLFIILDKLDININI